MESISLIIVNYNAGDLLKKCITAVEQQTVLPDEVIIIDNASSDNSITHIISHKINLRLIKLNTNRGFAQANNIALETVATPYVALLNPDAFPHSTWLEELLLCCKKYTQYSFFASNMLNAENPDIIDGQGDCYHISGLAWRHKHGKKQIQGKKAAPHEIFSACAGAALYRTKDLTEIDGFDEDFFCYMEDVDLCFRLLLSGKKGLYVPNAVVHHIGSAITGKKSEFSIYYGHRNLVWTYFKNMPLTLLLLTLPAHIGLNILSLLFFTFKGQGKTIIKSKYDALLGLARQMRKRRKIQNNKRISNKTLFSLMSKQLFRF